SSNRLDRLVSFIIQLDAPGDAHALGFSLNFDPNRLRFAGATSSREMSRAAFIVNADQSEEGRIGVVMMLPPGQRLPSGVRSLMVIHFSAVAYSLLSDAQIVCGDYPVVREIADTEANLLPATFEESVAKPELIRKMRERGNKIRQENGGQENGRQ